MLEARWTELPKLLATTQEPGATGDWGDRGNVPQDLEAAVRWYRRAANAGHAAAQYDLAIMLMDGEGCERDLAAAKEWFTRSLAGGYMDANELLVHLESLSRSEERDTAK